ncbi:uncharacterized protein METZ01_LOCUS278363 [marine metagenome]|uniref:Uncharacterized protein n=1 Tax=marine metagenome TaxID=408172 RepID=A0A382KMN8_9ZZZZ
MREETQHRLAAIVQVQTTRVAIDLGVVRWRPAGAVEVYWFV